MAFEASTGLAAKRAAMDTPASPQEVQATVDSPPPAPLEGTPEPADPAPTKDIPGDHDSVGASSPASTVPAGDAKVTVDDKGNQVPFKVLLTQDQALEIYKVRPMDNSPNAKPTSMDVAEQYGVSPKTVRDVWNRKTWVKVTKPLWAAGELELFLSESVRRGPGGRQPSPHGEDGEENEDGRSRRPVREARLNKRVLEAPAEEATVAKATTPRKTNPKKASKAGLAIAPPNAKRPKLSINTAPGSPVVLSGVSPGAMQRVRGGAGPKGGGKKNLHVFMPFSDIYQGQMHSSVHGDELDARALRPTDHWGGGGDPLVRLPRRAALRQHAVDRPRRGGAAFVVVGAVPRLGRAAEQRGGVDALAAGEGRVRIRVVALQRRPRLGHVVRRRHRHRVLHVPGRVGPRVVRVGAPRPPG